MLGKTRMFRDVTEPQPDLSWIPEPRQDTFGARLRMLRDGLELTLHEFAALTEIPHSSLSAWENETKKPRNMDEIVERIHAATSVNKVWLMFGTSLYKFRHLTPVPTATDHRLTSATNKPPMLAIVRDDETTR
jgi:transcriptional regulator with XRE-family HTH domain